MSGNNHTQLYIPPRFAHGFCVINDSADFLYKRTEYYVPEDEHGIIWNDLDIGIDWPGNDFTISEKDAKNSLLKSLEDRLPVYEEKS